MPASDWAPTETPVEPPVPPRTAAETTGRVTTTPAADSDWSPRRTPRSRFRISRGEEIADIVFTAVWISVVVNWTHVLAVLDRLDFPHEVPVPSAELIGTYYIWMVNVALVGIAVSILKIIIGRWNFPVGVAHTVYQSMNAMLTVAILNSGMLLRPETATRWAELSEGATVAEVLATVDMWGGIIGVIVSIAIAIDIIVRWVDVARGSYETTE